jgi:hypothetical protein
MYFINSETFGRNTKKTAADSWVVKTIKEIRNALV